MPNCYYTCNLLPLELVVRRGYAPRWLGNNLRDPNATVRRDALGVHPMTCPFVTKLVAAADELFGTAAAPKDDCLVVPAGCDAMRRMGDLMAATYPEQVYVLPMPRSSGAAVEAGLAEDLRRLDGWLLSRLPAGTAAPAAEMGPSAGAQAGGGAKQNGRRATDERPRVDYPAVPRPGGVFVVAGPLSDDSLLRLIHQLGSHVAALESCTSPDRWTALVATPAAEPPSAGPGVPGYEAFAARVLAAGVCPRRSTADRRAHLQRRLDEAAPASIIYARQSFCDPGAYDCLLVAQLAKERGLPYLEIEVDFPFDANGPLRVRVEAFLEAQLLDDDLLSHAPGSSGRSPASSSLSPASGERDPARAATPAATQCGDCPGALAGGTRPTVLEDDLADDLFDEEE